MTRNTGIQLSLVFLVSGVSYKASYQFCLTHLSLRAKSYKTDTKQVSYEASYGAQLPIKTRLQMTSLIVQTVPSAVQYTFSYYFLDYILHEQQHGSAKMYLGGKKVFSFPYIVIKIPPFSFLCFCAYQPQRDETLS